MSKVSNNGAGPDNRTDSTTARNSSASVSEQEIGANAQRFAELMRPQQSRENQQHNDGKQKSGTDKQRATEATSKLSNPMQEFSAFKKALARAKEKEQEKESKDKSNKDDSGGTDSDRGDSLSGMLVDAIARMQANTMTSATLAQTSEEPSALSASSPEPGSSSGSYSSSTQSNGSVSGSSGSWSGTDSMQHSGYDSEEAAKSHSSNDSTQQSQSSSQNNQDSQDDQNDDDDQDSQTDKLKDKLSSLERATDGGQQPTGDQVLQGMLGGLTPTDLPLDGTAAQQGAMPLSELVDKLADRVMVSDRAAGMDPEIQINLRDDVLQGAGITLTRTEGQLVVGFTVSNPELLSMLQKHSDSLQLGLQQRVSEPVHIEIKAKAGAAETGSSTSGDSSDGHSRNRREYEAPDDDDEKKDGKK